MAWRPECGTPAERCYFFRLVFRLVRAREVLLDPPDDLRDPPADFREGTFAPLLRASLSPIAIACLRLLTLRPDPLVSVPRFRRRIADSTFLDAARPYFATQVLLPRAAPCKARARQVQDVRP